MEPTEDAVVTKLWQLLPTVDITTTTTTDILKLLQESFGVSKEIEIFLDIKEEEPEDQHEDTKLEGEHLFAKEVKPLVYLRVTEFQAVRRVDIRYFYKAKKEAKTILKPTARGIGLTLNEFTNLLDSKKELQSAAERKETDFVVELGRNKRAAIEDFKGEMRLDLRNYYTEEKDQTIVKPTKKGISLEASILDVIDEHKDAVMKALEADSTSTKTHEGAKRGLEEREAEDPPRKQQKKESEDFYSLQLNERIRLRVTQFNGAFRTDIRSYYKDKSTGEDRPTQKGLSLTKAQLETLFNQMNALKQAVKDKDTSFYIELGSLRRASVSDFTGRLMVDLREYYHPKGGDSPRPGKKGVCFEVGVLDQIIDHQNEILMSMSE